MNNSVFNNGDLVYSFEPKLHYGMRCWFTDTVNGFWFLDKLISLKSEFSSKFDERVLQKLRISFMQRGGDIKKVSLALSPIITSI